jgi:2-polyprenyl-6-methoxyphenol hydroxylase-like FAD-dependent oxidoreductase
MGMSDAFLTADLLADALHHELIEDRPRDEALASYQHQRDALTANGFNLTLSTARLAPLSSRLEAFYRAAEGRPDIVSRIFGVLGGTISVTDLAQPSPATKQA